PGFLAAGAALVLGACAASGGGGGTSQPPSKLAEGATGVKSLGEPYKTPYGQIHVIRIQDEYRLLRCIPEGPIQGCYEDVLIVPREALSENNADGISWNNWIDVKNVPGLQVA